MLDVVDLASYAISTRINAGDTERQGQFTMPHYSVSNVPLPAGSRPHEVLPAAVIGARQVRLQTSYGTVMGMMMSLPFNVPR